MDGERLEEPGLTGVPAEIAGVIIRLGEGGIIWGKKVDMIV